MNIRVLTPEAHTPGAHGIFGNTDFAGSWALADMLCESDGMGTEGILLGFSHYTAVNAWPLFGSIMFKRTDKLGYRRMQFFL